jgi:hypothetical protein
MAKPTIKVLPVEDVPEVATFEEAKQRLVDFKEKHAKVFHDFEMIVAKYNASLEQAEKVVRAKEVSCGPFELYQHQTKYDPVKLYEELGREDFLAMGGEIGKTTTYSIDKTNFETRVARGDIPQEVAEAVTAHSPRYHIPDKIIL